MHDITFIRNQPDVFDAAMARRRLPPVAGKILALDEQRRGHVTRQGELQAERNALSKDIGMKKRTGENADDLMHRCTVINDEIKAVDAALAGDDELHNILSTLPNILADDVPDGANESDNNHSHTYGDKPVYDFTPKQHFDIGEALGVMDFDTAASMSGARFVILRKALARMERALASFMLDVHTADYNYEEVVPPLLVRSDALYGTSQLPKFAEDCYRTESGHWLIPTAEVSLTNMVAGKILHHKELPLRLCAYTPCFRSEAGSAGRDTRGMIRQHQFSKVELVSIVAPDEELAEHERLLGAAETIMQKLGLHYRVMRLCAGDVGFGAQATYDIEAWLPGQGAFREISSCSRFGAFQARRMKARYRKEGEKKTEYVHTLNGSGLAIGRTMVAILEHYQQADGSVRVPDILVPYMGGIDVINAAK